MKVMIPIEDNKVYSEILIRINEKEVILAELVKALNKKHPIVLKQLRTLEEARYIHINKKKNKNYYSVNWNKIKTNFLNLVEETIKDRLAQIEVFPHLKEEYKPLNKFNIDFKNKIINSKFLDMIFKTGFKQLNFLLNEDYDYFSTITLNTMFAEIYVSIAHYTNQYAYLFKKENNEKKLFEQFAEIIRISNINLLGCSIWFSEIYKK